MSAKMEQIVSSVGQPPRSLLLYTGRPPERHRSSKSLISKKEGPRTVGMRQVHNGYQAISAYSVTAGLHESNYTKLV